MIVLKISKKIFIYLSNLKLTSNIDQSQLASVASRVETSGCALRPLSAPQAVRDLSY